MTQDTDDRPEPATRHLMSVIPLMAAVEQPASPDEVAAETRRVVVPGPWRWFVHRDIPRRGGEEG